MNVKLEHPDPLRDLFIRRLIWAFSWIGLLLSVLIWTPGLKFIPPGYVPSMAEWREEIGELDLDSLASLGQHYKDFACYDSAIIVFQEMARMHWDARDTTAYWFTVGEIADCIRNAGQFKTGEILAGRVLQEIEKREGSNSAAYAWATYYWADYLRIRGKWNESLEMLNTSLAIQKQFLPEEHLLFSKTYHNIGLIFSQTGEYETSSQNFVWALEKRSQSKSKDFSNLYKIYLSMGILKYKLGNYTNSRDFLFAALRNQLKYYPPTHIDLLYTYSNLGKLFRKQKDFHRAAFFLDQALAILSYNRMIDSIEHAQILNLKALLNKDLGNLPKAEQLLIFAVEIYRKQLGDDGPSLGGYYCNLGEVYKMQGFAKRALKFYQNGITLLSKKYQLGKTVLITILFDKFNLQHQINNKIDSSLLREISTSIKAYFTDNVELKTEYFLFQANLMLKMHKFSTAKLYCDSAIAINSKIYSAIDTLSFKNSKKGLNEGIKLFEIYCLRGEINYKLFLSRPPSSTSEKFAHEALRNFDYSLSLASQIRKVYTSENSMFWIGAQSVPVIEMAIKTCWSIHQRKPNSAYIEKALLYSEKSKYQILLDAIIKLRAKRKYFSKSDLESYINLFEERNILLSKLEVFTDRNIESKISILIRQA
ncbi:MAG: tetratricopeptide repeat protein, partial [Bacteroidetes bacterium]|nr:tetratricopeptide repeat protein [Bacteroidota bacterium]